MNNLLKKKRNVLGGTSSIVAVVMVTALFLMVTAVGIASTADKLVLALEKKIIASDGVSLDHFGCSVAISGDTAIVGAYNDDAKGSAYVFEREGTTWTLTAKLTASDAAVGEYFGISVAISGDTAIVGAYLNDLNGAAYVFYRNQGGPDNWGEVKKLTASDAAADDWFGCSVAISGDTAIIGAWRNDSLTGSAYIFERNQGGANNWGEVKKLTASDAATDDYFGLSVSISGDMAIVGASGNDDNGVESGSAYIFERNQGGANNWGEVKKLTAGDAAAGDRFGVSVAICGDTAIVGAYGDDSWTGSAYIFNSNQGGADNWGQVKKIMASDGAANDYLGRFVAISGDTAIVGADGDDDLGLFSGSAYIFERNRGGANNWGEVKKLTASDGAANDYLGRFVAISGDTAIVGADEDDDNGNESGSAYFYPLLEVPENKVIASDGAASDEFGISVSISGDMAIVGASGDDSSQGSAYIFYRNQGGTNNWGEVKKLTASDGVANDLFGFSVAISGDTAIVGAWGNDDAGSNSGSAYIFYRNQGGADNWGEVIKLTASDAAASNFFGYSVAISGDTAIVGAWFSGTGFAYIFDRDQGGADNWGQVKKLLASDGVAGDAFGYSVSISGDTGIVGAYMDDALTGSAYTFARNQGGANNWGQVKKLTASDAAADDRFGYSVGIAGDTAVVGAIYDDDNGAESGSAYVFDRNQGGADNWGQVKKLLASDGFGNDRFGNSVAISGDTAIVGSYLDDDAGGGSGSAYIFERHQGGANNWGQLKKLTASDAAGGDQFGNSVSIDGNTAVVGANYDDDNGGASGSAYFYQLDLEGPVVQSITRYDPLLTDTNATTVTFMITFDETAHNLRLTNLGLLVTFGQSTAAIASISSSCGTTITVSVATVPDGDGAIRLDLATTGTITDTWFRPLQNTFYTGETYNVDRLNPTVEMSSTAPDPTSTLPIPVTVTFSEAVTDFQETDIEISDGSISNFNTVNAWTYTFDFSPATPGLATADIDAGEAYDAVGNPNEAAPQFSRTYVLARVGDWFMY